MIAYSAYISLSPPIIAYRPLLLPIAPYISLSPPMIAYRSHVFYDCRSGLSAREKSCSEDSSSVRKDSKQNPRFQILAFYCH